jgi:hypothetical protein
MRESASFFDVSASVVIEANYTTTAPSVNAENWFQQIIFSRIIAGNMAFRYDYGRENYRKKAVRLKLPAFAL